MVVSLSNIPKDSQVFRFITSGKRGRCALCFNMVEKLEAHHLCYSPQITIKLCHNCHHKVHFWPQRLNDFEKLKLLSKRFDVITANSLINGKITSPAALTRLIAPSRKVFIKFEQLKEQRVQKNKTKSSHSSEVQKVNKEVAL